MNVEVFTLTRPSEIDVFAPSRGTFIEVLGGGFGGGGGFIIPPDIARKSLPNVFTAVNTFNGLRFVPKVIDSAVTVDYFVTSTDTVLWVDASANPVTIHLPPSSGNGQLLLVIKADNSFNIVTILPQGLDTINDDIFVGLIDQWDWIEVIDAVSGHWGNFSKLSNINLPPNLAYVDASNVFTQPNSFTGLRLVGRIVTSSETLTPQDNIICVNAVDGPIELTLPPTQPDTSPDPRYGQWLYFKNISNSGNMVTISPVAATIDGAVSVNFNTLYSDLMIIDGAPGLWTDVGATGAEAGTAVWGEIEGTLSDQLDLQAALDLKLDIPSPLPARPTTLNQAIQVLVDGGLCAA